MATKRIGCELYGMKKIKLFSLVGITSIALANAGWAADHGGGGGGFGGGFHGGGFRGGGFSGGSRWCGGGGRRWGGWFWLAPFPRWGTASLISRPPLSW